MKRLRLNNLMMVVAAMLGGLGLTRAAEGSLIEFTFGGNLEQVNGTPVGPWAGIAVGDPFLVTYVFDSETPDLEQNPYDGIYDILSLVVSIDGITQSPAMAQIVIDIFDPTLHRYEARFQGLPDGGSGSIGLAGFFVLASDALPTTINLEDWNFSQIFEVAGNGSSFGGVTTTFSSRVVPFPSPWIFLGVMGLLNIGRRRRSSSEPREPSGCSGGFHHRLRKRTQEQPT